jgi:hypothetical protein
MRSPPGRRRGRGLVGPQAMRWILGGLFIVMAGWCLIPDKEDEGPKNVGKLGAFLATTPFAFFLVEMGDKTQLATVALAARFPRTCVTVTRRHDRRHAAGERAAVCSAMCWSRKLSAAAHARTRGRRLRDPGRAGAARRPDMGLFLGSPTKGRRGAR